MADWLAAALSSARSGAITINFEEMPAVRITADISGISVDLLQPRIFRMHEDTGLFDKLKLLLSLAACSLTGA